MPWSPTRALSRVKPADIEGSIQRFPQGRRVSLGAQLVDEFEDTSHIVVDLEDLHGQRGLKVRKGSLLWRLCASHWGFSIRQTGLDILETHGGGVDHWMDREQGGVCLIRKYMPLRIFGVYSSPVVIVKKQVELLQSGLLTQYPILRARTPPTTRPDLLFRDIQSLVSLCPRVWEIGRELYALCLCRHVRGGGFSNLP